MRQVKIDHRPTRPGSRGAVKICRRVRTMTIDQLPMTPSGTIRSDEVGRFNRLAATCWNRTGPMRPLHVVNELRLVHALEPDRPPRPADG
jgi:hypothetical protein